MLKRIKIASWNIAGGRRIRSLDLFDYKPEDVDYFSEELQKIDPDMLCIQEDHFSGDKSVAEKIGKQIGLKNICKVSMSPSHIDKDYLLGMAILSRYPLDKCKSTQLPYPKFKLLWKNGKEADQHHKYLQITTAGKLNISNFFSLPIQLWGYDYDRGKGKKYALEIQELLLKLKKPLILCGDFNFNEIKNIYPELFNKYKLTDALPSKTTRPTNNDNSENPDHILYSNEFKCIDSKIIKTDTDHYLCVAELEWLDSGVA